MKYGKRQWHGASLEIGVAAALPQHMRKDIVMVSKVYCEPTMRRQGYANTLLARVCLQADMERKMLMLKVGDGEEGALDHQALLEWYERYGFEIVQREPLLMLRQHIGMKAPRSVLTSTREVPSPPATCSP